MSGWFSFAIGAAVLYGLHQIFTKLASSRISDGLGGLVVEATAALTILVYLAWLHFGGRWNQTASAPVFGIRCSREYAWEWERYFSFSYFKRAALYPLSRWFWPGARH